MMPDAAERARAQEAWQHINAAIVALFHHTGPGRPPAVAPALDDLYKALEAASLTANLLAAGNLGDI